MGPAGHGQCLERSRRDRGRGKIFRARRALAGRSLIPAEDREEDGRHREPRGQGGRAAGWLLRARRGAWAQGPQAEVGGAAALASGRCAPCKALRHEAVITCSVLWAESQGASGEVFVVACESGTHEKSGGCRSGKIRALVLPHAASSSGMPGPPPVPARQGPCPRLPGRSPAR